MICALNSLVISLLVYSHKQVLMPVTTSSFLALTACKNLFLPWTLSEYIC